MKIMHSLFHFDFTKNTHYYDLLTKNVLKKKKDVQNIIPRHFLSYINTQTYKVMNQKKKTLKLIKL